MRNSELSLICQQNIWGHQVPYDKIRNWALLLIWCFPFYTLIRYWLEIKQLCITYLELAVDTTCGRRAKDIPMSIAWRRGVEGGSDGQSFLKGRWNCFKGNVGAISERRLWAHLSTSELFAARLDMLHHHQMEWWWKTGLLPSASRSQGSDLHKNQFVLCLLKYGVEHVWAFVFTLTPNLVWLSHYETNWHWKSSHHSAWSSSQGLNPDQMSLAYILNSWTFHSQHGVLVHQ